MKAETLYFSYIIIVCLFTTKYPYFTQAAKIRPYFSQKTTNVEKNIKIVFAWTRRYHFIPQVLLYHKKPQRYHILNFSHTREGVKFLLDHTQKGHHLSFINDMFYFCSDCPEFKCLSKWRCYELSMKYLSRLGTVLYFLKVCSTIFFVVSTTRPCCR